jgi:hypothetical protein
MPGITDHPDDFDSFGCRSAEMPEVPLRPREWAYPRARGAEAVVAALRPHLSEAIRRKAEVWLACELMPFLAPS